MIMVT